VGDNDSVKIADFGLALLNDSNRLVTFKPIRWMAPEAYFNDQFSNKSDVWSFGVLLYEIFSLGNDPYKDGHIDQIMDRVKNGMRLERPTRAPEDIYQLMESTWQDNPELRPSFADIFQTLNNITL